MLGCVLRPDDACQKRFSWYSDWIQKVQKCVNLVDLDKINTGYLLFTYVVAEVGLGTAENEPSKVCR